MSINMNLKQAEKFGSMMGKQAALDPAVANALGLGAAGLAGGGLLGALSGAVDPGYEDKEKRKRMSRLRAAIYGGLGGATLGGLGGAILGGGGTELMRVSPKIENWITGQKLKSQTDIPVDVVNDLKNKAVNFNVWAANRSYDDLGRDAHFEFMRKGMPKDQENWVEVFGKKVSPSWRSGPDWRINLNPGEPRATDTLFNEMGPAVVDNPFSRAANKATDMLSKLVSKKEK